MATPNPSGFGGLGGWYGTAATLPTGNTAGSGSPFFDDIEIEANPDRVVGGAIAGGVGGAIAGGVGGAIAGGAGPPPANYPPPPSTWLLAENKQFAGSSPLAFPAGASPSSQPPLFDVSWLGGPTQQYAVAFSGTEPPTPLPFGLQPQPQQPLFQLQSQSLGLQQPQQQTLQPQQQTLQPQQQTETDFMDMLQDSIATRHRQRIMYDPDEKDDQKMRRYIQAVVAKLPSESAKNFEDIWAAQPDVTDLQKHYIAAAAFDPDVLTGSVPSTAEQRLALRQRSADYARTADQVAQHALAIRTILTAWKKRNPRDLRVPSSFIADGGKRFNAEIKAMNDLLQQAPDLLFSRPAAASGGRPAAAVGFMPLPQHQQRQSSGFSQQRQLPSSSSAAPRYQPQPRPSYRVTSLDECADDDNQQSDSAVEDAPAAAAGVLLQGNEYFAMRAQKRVCAPISSVARPKTLAPLPSASPTYESADSVIQSCRTNPAGSSLMRTATAARRSGGAEQKEGSGGGASLPAGLQGLPSHIVPVVKPGKRSRSHRYILRAPVPLFGKPYALANIHFLQNPNLTGSPLNRTVLVNVYSSPMLPTFRDESGALRASSYWRFQAPPSIDRAAVAAMSPLASDLFGFGYITDATALLVPKVTASDKVGGIHPSKARTYFEPTAIQWALADPSDHTQFTVPPTPTAVYHLERDEKWMRQDLAHPYAEYRDGKQNYVRTFGILDPAKLDKPQRVQIRGFNGAQQFNDWVSARFPSSGMAFPRVDVSNDTIANACGTSVSYFRPARRDIFNESHLHGGIVNLQILGRKLVEPVDYVDPYTKAKSQKSLLDALENEKIEKGNDVIQVKQDVVKYRRMTLRSLRDRATPIKGKAPVSAEDDARGRELPNRAADRIVAERAKAQAVGESIDLDAERMLRLVHSTPQPLRSHIIRLLHDEGDRTSAHLSKRQPHPIFNREYLESHCDVLFDQGSTSLTDVQFVQLADAFYWTTVAPEALRKPHLQQVVDFYADSGHEMRLGQPYSKHGGRMGEDGKMPRNLKSAAYNPNNSPYLYRFGGKVVAIVNRRMASQSVRNVLLQPASAPALFARPQPEVFGNILLPLIPQNVSTSVYGIGRGGRDNVLYRLLKVPIDKLYRTTFGAMSGGRYGNEIAPAATRSRKRKADPEMAELLPYDDPDAQAQFVAEIEAALEQNEQNDLKAAAEAEAAAGGAMSENLPKSPMLPPPLGASPQSTGASSAASLADALQRSRQQQAALSALPSLAALPSAAQQAVAAATVATPAFAAFDTFDDDPSASAQSIVWEGEGPSRQQASSGGAAKAAAAASSSNDADMEDAIDDAELMDEYVISTDAPAEGDDEDDDIQAIIIREKTTEAINTLVDQWRAVYPDHADTTEEDAYRSRAKAAISDETVEILSNIRRLISKDKRSKKTALRFLMDRV